MREARGSLGPHNQGLIIITNDFWPWRARRGRASDAVRGRAENGEQLVALLVEHGSIGVQRTPHDLIELGTAGDE